MKSTAQGHPAQKEISNLTTLFNQRRYAEAESLARSITKRYPQHGFAWKLLGALLGQSGRLDEALAAMQKVVELMPNDAEAQSNLGLALQMQNRLQEAEGCFRRALQIKPGFAGAYFNLGNTLRQMGQLADAEDSYQQALKLKPDFAEAAYNLGATQQQLGRPVEAEQQFRQAIRFKPDFAAAHLNLGNLCRESGRSGEAEGSYRRALELQPRYAEAHNNLGALLRETGRLAESEACYRSALMQIPDSTETHYNLGVTLKELYRLEESEVSFRRALQLSPNNHRVSGTLGTVLHNLGRQREAEACCRRALELAPNSPEAYSNMGFILIGTGRFDEAVVCYRRALELKPDYPEAQSNLLFCLNYHPDKSAEEIFVTYQEYDQRIGQPQRGDWPMHCNDRSLGRRLKVGYVSPDFRKHSCRHFIEPLLTAHDRGAVELFGYAELGSSDAYTERYKKLFDHWLPTKGMTDAALVERIQADGIDILVDLAGHTAGNRLSLFARKPAPVQVSWLGYGYTTGLTAIDYYLTDNVCVPEGSEHLFSEKPWHLSPNGLCYRPAEGMGEVSPLPALARGYVTFGTLTRAVRINHRTIRVWAAILKQLPTARLVMDSSNFRDESLCSSIKQQFLSQGIGADRLITGFHTPPWDLLRGIDLTLDCFPHNSGTTLFESLYMGVPFISLVGRPSVGRLGASILNALGHPEWVAQSEEEYIEKAVVLAEDLIKLAELRTALRCEMECSPLMDENGFARKIESAYRQMWRNWCEKQERGGAVTIQPSQPQQPDSQEIQALGALYTQGRHAEAEQLARTMIGRYPRHALAWKVLGAVLGQTGRLDEALLVIQRLAVLMPDDAEVHNNLGLVLQMQKRPAEAETSFRRALEIKPEFAEAYYNLGNIQREVGRMTEAASSLRNAVQLQPHAANAHSNLGNVLRELGRLDEAEASCRRALELKPDFTEAYYNLGAVLQVRGRLHEAETCCRRALELAPNESESHCNLGNVFLAFARFDDAVVCYRRALELKPDYPEAQSNLLFCLDYHPDLSAEEIFTTYQEHNQRYSMPFHASWRLHGNTPDPAERRLRVGYVSPDFRYHACHLFVEPFLAHHDKAQVEVFAYAELNMEDQVTARYRGYVDHWIPTKGMSDEALTERIRQDGIDILVELAGHTAGNRLPVFARKPAPVSICWPIGSGCTTGLTAIDYCLIDRDLAPPGSEHLFSEQVWYMDSPPFCYRPNAEIGDLAPLPVLERGYITFGTLTRLVRINHRVIVAWSAILKAVPGSRLVIDNPNYRSLEIQELLASKFAEHGIERNRLEIGESGKPVWEAMAGMDIILDCFPCNNGTTLYVSIYMGVPFITLAGRPPLGLAGAGILQTSGHPELVAWSEEEYIEKAVELAGDIGRLKGYRATLRTDMQNSGLRDEAGFARKMEANYRQMWRNWCKKQEQGDAVAIQPSQPQQPDSQEIQALGALYTQGRHAEAEQLARSMIGRYPQHALAWKVLGAVLGQTGRLDEALAVKQKTVELAPNDAEAHNNLGNALREAGRPIEAEISYRRAVELRPVFAEAHYNLGNMLFASGRLEEALVSCRCALELKPDYVEAYSTLGSVLYRLDRFADAEVCFRRALQIKPDFAEGYNNLGLTLQKLGRLDEAETCFRGALNIKPDSDELYKNLGSLMHQLVRLDEAEANYRRALQLNPDNAGSLHELGAVLHRLERQAEAEAHCRRALELDPDNAEAHGNLGVILAGVGRLNEAEICYRRALELKPDSLEAQSNLLYCLDYHPDLSAEEIFTTYQEHNQRYSVPFHATWRPHGNSADPERRLRVGYLSPDFRYHACHLFVEPFLAHHDKAQVEVFAYAELNMEDQITARYRSYVDHWIATKGMNDDALAERIRQDGIDILVELAGHTAGNRLPVFARKPAPVSICWPIGSGCTTGLTAIDYCLIDKDLAPPGSEHLFSEQVWYMDSPPFCYRPNAEIGDVAPLPALERGHITFGTLTRLVRINHRVIAAWSAILKAVPDSKLVIDNFNYRNPEIQELLASKFAAHGISRDRLEIGESGLPVWEAMAGMDIILDCFPCNNGTTLYVSVYMGVPFITLAGRPPLGRAGAGILQTAGHPELIAWSEEEYIKKAVELAGDIERLRGYRATLRNDMQNSGLRDEAGFARKMEANYRQMWRNWCGEAVKG